MRVPSKHASKFSHTLDQKTIGVIPKFKFPLENGLLLVMIALSVIQQSTRTLFTM